MAKQTGDKITGTYGNITFYKMEGMYYARLKSSLTRKQFRRKKCFERSRQSASRFGEGNKIAGLVYRSLPERRRVYALFCVLKTKAIALLKQGMEAGEVKENLQQFVQPVCRKRRLQRKKDIIKPLPNHFLRRTAVYVKPLLPVPLFVYSRAFAPPPT